MDSARRGIMLMDSADLRKPVEKKAKTKLVSKFDQVASAAARKDISSTTGKIHFYFALGIKHHIPYISAALALCIMTTSASVARSNEGCPQTTSASIQTQFRRPVSPLRQSSFKMLPGEMYLSLGLQISRIGQYILAAVF